MKGAIHRLLRARGETVGSIAAAARVSRPHLSLVLSGKPGRGTLIWKHVEPWLTDEEVAAVGRERVVSKLRTDPL